ncbi:hypothetical protein AAGF08_16560, partial [Algoriphagus sp. SE2]|uniref:hypothetical protein n=1 Tax=Algoriphagus sp. SE2 TaxID=3141536 RepID=UPI0031CD5999
MNTFLQPQKKRFSFQKGVTFLLLFFHFSFGFSVAQQLSGSYSIGASGDYSTFSDAISALTTNGVSGPVIFDVQSGTYTEQVVLGAISGASETNTITFQSQSGNAGDVVLSHTANSTVDNYVISLEGASNLIFKDMTVKALGTTYGRTVVGQLELNNILFQGNIFDSPLTNSTGTERGNIVITAVNSTKIKFLGNNFLGGSYGVYFLGTNSNAIRALDFEFSGNSVINSFHRGVLLSRLLDSQIEENFIQMLSTSSSSSKGIELSYLDGGTHLLNNRVSGAKSTGVDFKFSNGSGV